MTLRIALFVCLSCVIALLVGALPAAASDVSVRVVRCPTSYGISQRNKRLPKSIATGLTASQASGLAFYGNNELLVLAPAAWRCSGEIGADGSAGMGITRGQRTIAVQAVPYTSSVGAGEACSLFADADPPAPCPEHPPRRERIERLSRTAVAFEDPPGVHGTGQPSGGSFPANGVMLFNPSSKGFFYGETCVLPASEHTVCTLLLNDALRRAPL
jgi:hypothetical protein